MQDRKYSDEYLAEIVKQATSMCGVFRLLDMQRNGTSYRYIKARLLNAGIDTSHFLGLRNALGKVSSQRKPASEILVLRRSKERQPSARVRRALLEIGRPYECEKCSNRGIWYGSPLQLEIDHKNGNRSDDRAENLRFMCPNCHGTETDTSKTHPTVVINRCKCGKRISKKSVACHKHKFVNVRHPEKIAWPELDVLVLAKSERRVKALAKTLGVSDVAVHKRIKRLTTGNT